MKFIRENDKEVVVKITDSGRKYLKTFNIDDIVLNRPEHWDGKWRLVIFDVPEKHKKARDALRRKLKDLGFVRLQDSAWVTPYPCDDEESALMFLR